MLWTSELLTNPFLNTEQTGVLQSLKACGWLATGTQLPRQRSESQSPWRQITALGRPSASEWKQNRWQYTIGFSTGSIYCILLLVGHPFILHRYCEINLIQVHVPLCGNQAYLHLIETFKRRFNLRLNSLADETIKKQHTWTQPQEKDPSKRKATCASRSRRSKLPLTPGPV